MFHKRHRDHLLSLLNVLIITELRGIEKNLSYNEKEGGNYANS
ncbi:hypothetical protein HOLDEFILI_02679 [Holdemania filiformis DSM 12042]|uniref:Uncharacterized protein n=1 Tax=Holdemania filiformis DSM 12042 TaxID=545696 RepID=B9YA21_9FIRM|nr:hypothetical protein HOLDEFILI_02679 [Holdemania filiformis DSM 12042]